MGVVMACRCLRFSMPILYMSAALEYGMTGGGCRTDGLPCMLVPSCHVSQGVAHAVLRGADGVHHHGRHLPPHPAPLLRPHREARPRLLEHNDHAFMVMICDHHHILPPLPPNQLSSYPHPIPPNQSLYDDRLLSIGQLCNWGGIRPPFTSRRVHGTIPFNNVTTRSARWSYTNLVGPQACWDR